MATKEELLERLKDGVVEYKEEQSRSFPGWLDEGYAALEGIMDGLAAGMEMVGDLYDRKSTSSPKS